MTDIKDKYGEPIRRGDHVFTPIRGGRHEGIVDKIVMSEEDAAEEGVKRPPKVRHGVRSRTISSLGNHM